MITHNTVFITSNRTGETFVVPDVKQLINDIFERYSMWSACDYFENNQLTDSHGKSLEYLVLEKIAEVERKRSARYRGRIFCGYKRNGASVFRRPKTTAELRQVAALKADGHGNLIRRHKSSIPTVWDDIWRGDMSKHNWKRQRRTQYK